jgi:hypothetical protein
MWKCGGVNKHDAVGKWPVRHHKVQDTRELIVGQGTGFLSQSDVKYLNVSSHEVHLLPLS